MASTPVSNLQANDGTPHKVNKANSGSPPQRLADRDTGKDPAHSHDNKRRKLGHDRMAVSSEPSPGDNVTAAGPRDQDLENATSETVNQVKRSLRRRNIRRRNKLMAFCIAAFISVCFHPLIIIVAYIITPPLNLMIELLFQWVELVWESGSLFMLATAFYAVCLVVYMFWRSRRVRVRTRR